MSNEFISYHLVMFSPLVPGPAFSPTIWTNLSIIPEMISSCSSSPRWEKAGFSILRMAPCFFGSRSLPTHLLLKPAAKTS